MSPLTSLRHRTRGVLRLALIGLWFTTAAWGETAPAGGALHAAGTTLPGTAIALTSAEQDGLLRAEVSGLLPHPFDTAAPALAKVENWCQFMPLHFNIKACTYETRDEGEVLTLYSGRKGYQTPAESHALAYRFQTTSQGNERLSLLLHAANGPANTRDYRIELEARRVPDGTLLHVRSSYRPSMTSALLTRTYLSTLGRDKVGFTRIEQGGEARLVQGVRGVIERNVMRYHLAIETFLDTKLAPAVSPRTVVLSNWFKRNDRYAQQLHEMTEAEYLSIKRREWENQQSLQQALNESLRHLAAR